MMPKSHQWIIKNYPIPMQLDSIEALVAIISGIITAIVSAGTVGYKIWRKFFSSQETKSEGQESLNSFLLKHILQRVKSASQVSIARASSRLLPDIPEKHIVDSLITPRKAAFNAVTKFLDAEETCMVIVAESGHGKSTFMYQLALGGHFNAVPLFYDAHQIQAAGSFHKRLEIDFQVADTPLFEALKKAGKAFRDENRKLLILIDGLNEYLQRSPIDLRLEIEAIAAQLPISIKILYTCRKVYWDTYIRDIAPIPQALYFLKHEFLLSRFDAQELILAFDSYKKTYNFSGNLDDLSPELKDKLQDPLMLRMFSEGHSDMHLPENATLTFIFDSYLARIDGRFRGTILMEYMWELISHMISTAEVSPDPTDIIDLQSIRINPKFTSLAQQQLAAIVRAGDPLVLLQDEGILIQVDQNGRLARFAYDRFFEYLIGRHIGRVSTRFENENEFVEFIVNTLQRHAQSHFSFTEGLKSEIVRKNLLSSLDSWSMYRTTVLRALLTHPGISVQSFAKEVIRELILSSDKDMLHYLKQANRGINDWRLTAIEIASDSDKVHPLLIGGLFSEEPVFTLRSTQILSLLVRAPGKSEEIQNKILSAISTEASFDPPHARGLIYFTTVIFSAANHFQLDGIHAAQAFWTKVLRVSQAHYDEIVGVLAGELTELIRSNGALFFGPEFTPGGLDYYWTRMSPEVRSAALSLAAAVKKGESVQNDIVEIIQFFSMMVEPWGAKEVYTVASPFAYQIEYRIAQWWLIRLSRENYKEVSLLLNKISHSRQCFSIDFCLGVMWYILKYAHPDNSAIVQDGYALMREWNGLYEQDPSNYYQALEKEDPFNYNHIPFVMIASVHEQWFSDGEEYVTPIAEKLLSEDARHVKIGLLSIRWIWRENPKKYLRTLTLALSNKHELITNWIDATLKEIYLTHPFLAEEFFRDNAFSQERINRIKYMINLKRQGGIMHNGNPLYKALLLGSSERLDTVISWYSTLLNSESLDSFCRQLIEGLANECN